MCWVTRSHALHTLSTYVTPKTVFGRGERKAPHGDPAFTLCPPDTACDACRAFSDAVSDGVRVDVRAALQAALRDGWEGKGRLFQSHVATPRHRGVRHHLWANTTRYRVCPCGQGTIK